VWQENINRGRIKQAVFYVNQLQMTQRSSFATERGIVAQQPDNALALQELDGTRLVSAGFAKMFGETMTISVTNADQVGLDGQAKAILFVLV
jgi:hypothetical protein